MSKKGGLKLYKAEVEVKNCEIKGLHKIQDQFLMER